MRIVGQEFLEVNPQKVISITNVVTFKVEGREDNCRLTAVDTLGNNHILQHHKSFPKAESGLAELMDMLENRYNNVRARDSWQLRGITKGRPDSNGRYALGSMRCGKG